MSHANVTVDNLTASSMQTVKDIVDVGFNWVYDKLHNSLAVCSHTCGPSGGLPMSMSTKEIKSLM
jgi:hypothetical protein